MLVGLGTLDRIDRLEQEPSDDLEVARRLRDLRHQAVSELPAAGPPSAIGEPPSRLDCGLPSLRTDELSAAAVKAAIIRSGSVLVRGLLNPTQVERLKSATDRAIAGRDARSPGKPVGNGKNGWFEPFQPDPPYAAMVAEEWNRLTKGGGTLWAVDSPRGLSELLAVLDEVGLRRLAADYLGGRPVLSMKKCNLRRTAPQATADWHQDGAFLGGKLGALNVWAALTRCGVDAPGMDLVARRLEEVVETGTEGARFDWTVGHPLVERVATPEGIVRPEFEPGDVLLFDELCLHRTAANPAMTNHRHAVEVWMFRADDYPQGQVPLVF